MKTINTPHTAHLLPHTPYLLPLTSHLVFCFLLSFSCFGQAVQSPKDAPHFVYQTSIGMGYGMGKIFVEKDTFPNGNFTFEIQQLLAYQFNNHFFTGVGAGLDFWFYDKQTSTFIPIFANVTVKLMNKKTAPFAFANFGYSFKWQTEQKLEDVVFYGTKAGIYLQAGVGLNLKFSDKLSLLMTAYYKMQNSAVKVRESELILSEIDKIYFHFVGIKIGLLY